MFKSVISTLRQFIVCKIMPYPQFTEEDYRAAEREYAGKAPRKGAAPEHHTYGRDVQMVGGRPKSLFHMDDDDYVAKVEEEMKRQKDEEETKSSSEETVEGVALKQYDRPAKKNKKKTDENDTSDHNEQ
jgi:hypothetical protein